MPTRLLARLALLLLLVSPCACAASQRSRAATWQASRQFSHDAYCPIDRVSAERSVPVPVAPAAIARDPERAAMWREAHEHAVLEDARQVIAVDGCGEQTAYACWDMWVWERAGRRRHKVVVGASCNEMTPMASGGGSGPHDGPRPVQGVSTRSTTFELQPNTTASSR
jgi:hypothetical protein